jgi:hypothetical protein
MPIKKNKVKRAVCLISNVLVVCLHQDKDKNLILPAEIAGQWLILRYADFRW